MKKYVIIGNGAAGNSAAEAIRKNDPEAAISVFSREKFYFYYVPALPEYLCGEKRVENFTLHNKVWYEKNRIDIHLDTRITQIDPAQKILTDSNGEKVPYDKLLLACGGNSYVPPLPGAELAGVFTLRTIADADAIRERAVVSKRAVMIGGGLVGLEAGNGLRKIGLEISILEFFPRLLPRQTDPQAAAMLKAELEKMGFRFYLGTKTEGIFPAGKGLRVRMAGGEEIETDLTLISAGVRPELILNRYLNFPVNIGIKVDDTMKTAADDIYAAGDIVEHRGRFYGIWPASMDQGKVAGANMAGQSLQYQGTVPANVLKVAGIDLMAAGEIDPEGKMESIIQRDEAHVYRKLVIKDNVLVGAILLGSVKGGDDIQRAIRAGKDISSLKSNLGKEDFDFTKLRG
jgi:nitrite reductase (NADH) large subunit